MQTERGGCPPELVITLFILLLLVGLAIPRLDSRAERRAPGARELLTLFGAAQDHAVEARHDVALSFDTLDGVVRVHLDANSDGRLQRGEEIRFVDVGGGYRFSRAAAPELVPGADAVSFSRIRSGLPSLVFHADGHASESGVVYIVPGSYRSVSPDPDQVRAVEVAGRSGRARCWRVSAGTWEPAC
jgi:hypothetical protein